MKRPKTTPVPVRLDEVTRSRLRRAAKTMGSNDSAVIRLAILIQLPDIERGRITFNPVAA